MNKLNEEELRIFIEDLISTPKNRKVTAFKLISSFEWFIRIIYPAINGGNQFKMSPPILKVIRMLEQYSYGVNKKKNLCICLPPGAGKSEIGKLWVAWNYIRSIDNAFLYVSHSDDMIVKRSKEIKDILIHPFIFKVFGFELKNDEKSKVNWSFKRAVNRSGLFAASMGSGLTGLDAGRGDRMHLKQFTGALIIDDPIDAVKAQSEVERQKVITIYENTLKRRLRSPLVPIILIMQRLHEEDLVGYIKENEKEDWEFIDIPVLDENDKSFWESRFPAATYIKMRDTASTAYIFHSQYQQNPIQIQGEIIKSGWFKWYTLEGNMDFDKVFLVADTAMKIKEHNDYSVICCFATSGGNLYLLDMRRGKWEAPDLKKEATSFWNKWEHGVNGQYNNGFYIEDKASGTGLIQELKITTGIPIIPLETSSVKPDGTKIARDKLTRVEDVLTWIESGRVFLPATYPEITSPLIAECSAFRRDGLHKHDDIVDCVVYGIEVGLVRRKASLFDAL